jgi:3-oxoadipate enol-lactonase
MGGMIAVDLAVRYPARVAALVLLAAMSPDPTAGIGEAFFDGLEADPVAGTLAAMGAPTREDEAWLRRRLQASRQRAAERPDAGIRHQAAAFRLGWRELIDLDRIDAHTLIIHGTADRVLPPAHAHAFAQGLRHTELHLVEGMGHLPTRREWNDLAELTSRFLAVTGLPGD